MATITYQDVAVTLGRPISDPLEQAQVTQWIADVETLVSHRLGDLTLLDQAVLSLVERESVAARVRNPNGYTSETIDDYTYRRSDASAANGWITDEWWDLLAPDSSEAAFSIRAGGVPTYPDPDTWVTPDGLL